MQRRLPGFAAIRTRLAGRFLLGTVYVRRLLNRNLAMHRTGRFFLLAALLNCRTAAGVAETDLTRGAPALQQQSPKVPVDQLIPWLLDEEAQLRGIPFSEVIVDVTGKKVLAFDAKNEIDQRVAKGISAACDEAMKRLNAPGSPIQTIARINEVSSYFEDTLRELLNST